MTKWITVAQAATIARRHKRTIYRWIDEGLLSVREDQESRVEFVLAVEVLQVEATRRPGRPTSIRPDVKPAP